MMKRENDVFCFFPLVVGTASGGVSFLQLFQEKKERGNIGSSKILHITESLNKESSWGHRSTSRTIKIKKITLFAFHDC